MKFYIATGLANYAEHNRLRDELVKLGHEITYDWTEHGPVWDQGLETCRLVADYELRGVKTADFLVVIIPHSDFGTSGRGTHAELGAGLVLGVPTIICSHRSARDFTACPDTCAFYHHPSVLRRVPLELGYNVQGLAELISNAALSYHGLAPAIRKKNEIHQ